jgi:IMP dehydrogenase
MREGLSYDDVLLVPQMGELTHRKDADISTQIGPFRLEVPILSANMPSVTGPNMVRAMDRAGGLGVLHRFSSIEENLENLLDCAGCQVGVSIGLKDGFERTEAFLSTGRNLVYFLDTAHGDQVQVYNFIARWKQTYPELFLVAGNIATRSAALCMANYGVDGVKIGIGPGAACTTREVTGFGVPQWTAIRDVAEALEDYNIVLIADGGIKNSGDIVKALAAGADMVMIGRLLAGCDEAPDPGVYYGNASAYINRHNAPEGVYGHIERCGPVERVIKRLAWGIRSGISYGGATNIAELQKHAEWIRVSPYAAIESSVRL